MTSLSRRIAATFQAGRDPDQDKIVEWLKTLPISSKGNVERSVMKYHITRALLMYIQSGSMGYTSSTGHTLQSENSRPTNQYNRNTSIPDSSAPAVVAPTIKPKGSGSLLRKKIASSMNSGN